MFDMSVFPPARLLRRLASLARHVPRSLAGLAAGLVALLAAAPGHATVVIGYDLPGLVAASDQIVRGRVVSQNARWDAKHERIFTDVVVEVEARFKGQPARTVTIQRLGGQVGDLSMKVIGEASFAPGEEVFLFLRDHKKNLAVPFSAPVGMAQGKLRITRAPGKPATVQFHPEGLTKAVARPGTPYSLLHATPTETALDELEAQVRSLVTAK